MARKRTPPGSFSLFPFMSILTCLMGILSFIMVSIVTVSTALPEITIEMEGDHSKHPRFVECRAEGAVLHPEGTKIPQAEMAAAGSPFMNLMEELKQKTDSEYVIFLVFPEGVDCFYAGRTVAENLKVDIGFEPMMDDWRFHSARRSATEEGPL